MQTRDVSPANGRWTTVQVVGAIGLLIATLSIAQSQEPAPAARPASRPAASIDDETPIGPRWWPSKYGALDQRGAANLLTAAKVVEAARLIKEGNVYQLGRVYEREMPTFPHRTFRLTIPAFHEVLGENRRVGRDEFFVGEIGQMGTQMDGLGHVGVRLPQGDTYYNGFRSADIEEPYGLTKLGVENVGVFFTRGVLIDVAADRGVERLPVGFEITLEHLMHALKSQRLEIHQGDVVLLHTGHGRLWKVDNDTYNSGQPGIGLAAARWLSEQQIAAVGADNWGIEVDPSPNLKRPLEGVRSADHS